MNYILVGPDGRPSMYELLENYNFKNDISLITHREIKNNQIIWSHKGKWVKRLIVDDADILIRWGDRSIIPFIPKIEYNGHRGLSNASNKKMARELMFKAKVPVPTPISHLKPFERNKPVVIRPLHHRGGNDFVVIREDEVLQRFINDNNMDNYYISEVYEKTREYRVHCALGKVLLIKEKPKPENLDTVAWNFEVNELPWTTINRKDYDIEMCKIALSAIKAVGLDFGAVDIMAEPKDKKQPKYAVLEVNTAPSMTPYLIEKYGMLFDMMLSSPKEKIKDFDTSGFKKGNSFAWKNFQLKNEKK